MKFSRSNGDGYTATCSASHIPGAKHQFLEYDLHCNRNGDAACSCPDFQTHGGACKHLRAFRLAIEHWIFQRLETPFHFPISHEEAETLRHLQLPVVESRVSEGVTVPVPQVVQWDPTIIQSLGGDRTILGDEDDELQELVNFDSDLDMDDSLDSDAEFEIGTVCSNVQMF
jgi:hypothetical protein